MTRSGVQPWNWGWGGEPGPQPPTLLLQKSLHPAAEHKAGKVGTLHRSFQTQTSPGFCLFLRPRNLSLNPLITHLLAFCCLVLVHFAGIVPTPLTPVCALSPWPVTTGEETKRVHLTFLLSLGENGLKTRPLTNRFTQKLLAGSFSAVDIHYDPF